jgi:hypothetical protein
MRYSPFISMVLMASTVLSIVDEAQAAQRTVINIPS